MKRIFSRFFLILFGLFCGILLFEVTLQVSSFVAQFYYARSVRREVADAKAIRILAIGESTTAGTSLNSWPSQLQDLLQKKVPGRTIQVFNRGLWGHSSDSIAEKLPIWMGLYQPQVVVSMVGINDRQNVLIQEQSDPGILSFLPHLRSYRFLQAVVTPRPTSLGANVSDSTQKTTENIERSIKINQCKSIASQENEEQLEESFSRLHVSLLRDLMIFCGNISELRAEQKISHFLVQRNPSKETLRDTSHARIWPGQDLKQSYAYINQYIQRWPDCAQCYYELGMLNYEQKNWQESSQNFVKAVKLDALEFGYYERLIPFIAEKSFPWQEYLPLFENLLSLTPDQPRPLVLMAEFLKSAGQFAKASEYAAKALTLSNPTPDAYRIMAEIQTEGQERQKYYQAGVQAYPRDFKLSDGLARHFFDHSQFEKSISVYLKFFKAEGSKESEKDQIQARKKAINQILRNYINTDRKEISPVAEKFLKQYHLSFNENEFTQIYYRKIRDQIKSRGAQHIAMQYPMMEMSSLKEILGNDSSVFYLENKTNFEAALKTHRKEEIFSDDFAAQFGHLTDFGNSLVAENVAQAVLGIIAQN